MKHPGTYRGAIEKIPYLKELGVTAVELMPVHEFNEQHVIGMDPQTRKPLRKYWGYDPVAFFAPKASYSSSGDLGQQKLEFKEMVMAFHDAGIEVILDVVLQSYGRRQTSSARRCVFAGSTTRPSIRWRPTSAITRIIQAPAIPSMPTIRWCGNTSSSALRYWVVEMHVDGFRFDLASILGRDGNGNLLSNPPLIERIAEDPILRGTKLIAEAWDAAGAYQVGSFFQRNWVEWNGRYRDDVRRFWRGDDGMLGAFASRISGSADIFAGSGKGPERSVNFVTCHDGFTLNDLVSYRHKHNEANGEGNRDGSNENFSENYGVEGATRGCRHRVGAQAPDQEFPADVADLARHTDVDGRRRIPPHATRKQQRLLPGQRNELV